MGKALKIQTVSTPLEVLGTMQDLRDQQTMENLEDKEAIKALEVK